MSKFYETFNVDLPEEDLTHQQKIQLSKWLNILRDDLLIKKIYILISEHAKREHKEHIEPYGMTHKEENNNIHPYFSLQAFPIQLRQILWKFYLFHK